MNKKNITLILIGILLLVFEFRIAIGSASIDICSDVIGFILITIGTLPLAIRNINFKKSRNSAVLGLIAVIIGQALTLVNWGESQGQIITLSSGLTTIFAIYYTYYFTEGLILEAKFQEKQAATRSFRLMWALLGALIFAKYITFLSTISMISIILQTVTGICAIFFCYSILTASRQLYMEGLPTKHMANQTRK